MGDVRDGLDLAGGLLLATTLTAISHAVGWLASRSRRMERLVEGEPVLQETNGDITIVPRQPS